MAEAYSRGMRKTNGPAFAHFNSDDTIIKNTKFQGWENAGRSEHHVRMNFPRDVRYFAIR
jgi:hypothetical protein